MMGRLKEFWKKFDALNRARAGAAVEWELAELEHVFGLLSAGALVGFPAPPLQITLDLLPDLEQDLMVMLSKVETARGPLSDLFSTLDIG